LLLLRLLAAAVGVSSACSTSYQTSCFCVIDTNCCCCFCCCFQSLCARRLAGRSVQTDVARCRQEPLLEVSRRERATMQHVDVHDNTKIA
jgi:hypothetical protein